MTKFDIRLVKQHLLFDYDGKVILVDTGAGVTFKRGDNQFQFLEGTYQCSNYVMPPRYLDDASKFVGERIDVMMGTNILRDYKVVIDYEGKTLSLYGQDEEVGGPWLHEQNLDFVSDGHIGMPVQLNGREAKVAIDTGAIIQYVDNRFTDGIASVDTAQDFHHVTGDFTTGIYPVAMEADGDSFSVRFGNLPSVLQGQLSAAGGFDGVVGWDFFSQRKVLIDFQNRVIKWS